MNRYYILGLLVLGGISLFILGLLYMLYLIKFFKDVENCELDSVDSKMRDFLYTHTLINIFVWSILGIIGLWKIFNVWRGFTEE